MTCHIGRTLYRDLRSIVFKHEVYENIFLTHFLYQRKLPEEYFPNYHSEVVQIACVRYALTMKDFHETENECWLAFEGNAESTRLSHVITLQTKQRRERAQTDLIGAQFVALISQALRERQHLPSRGLTIADNINSNDVSHIVQTSSPYTVAIGFTDRDLI